MESSQLAAWQPRRTQDPRIEIEGVIVEDKQELCNKFGDYFTSIGTKIQAETRNSQALLNGKSFAGERGVGMEMEVCPCDSAKLTKVISSMGSNSAGLDDVNLKAIRSILVYILPVQTRLEYWKLQ